MLASKNKKKILLIEDTLDELSENGEELENAGFEVIRAGSTSKANTSIVNHNGYFDCVIIDLNMSSKRLSSDLAKKTHGGSLTGWIWLYYDARSKINSKQIIIYSEFIGELQEYLQNVSEDELNFYNSTVSIPKTAAVNNSLYLVTQVENLIGKGNE